jgi:hypothetical protein
MRGRVWLLHILLWHLPAQSFSGSSPLGLETLFYYLRFETSIFVASYYTQGHGGGIRPRLHAGSGPDHTENTEIYCCVAQSAQKRSHVVTIWSVHWRAHCFLATVYKCSSYCCVNLSEVFIAPFQALHVKVYWTFQFHPTRPTGPRSGPTHTVWLSDYSVRLVQLLCRSHVLLGRALLFPLGPTWEGD